MSATATADTPDEKTSEEDANPDLNAADNEIIAGAERALKQGVELKEWWERIDQRRTLHDSGVETKGFQCNPVSYIHNDLAQEIQRHACPI